MTFTIIFKSTKRNAAYQLCFEPNAIWRKDMDWYLIPTRTVPYYQLGSLKELLIKEKLYQLEEKECMIIVQEEGIGTEEDLDTLKKDLANEGFSYKVATL